MCIAVNSLNVLVRALGCSSPPCWLEAVPRSRCSTPWRRVVCDHIGAVCWVWRGVGLPVGLQGLLECQEQYSGRGGWDGKYGREKSLSL